MSILHCVSRDWSVARDPHSKSGCPWKELARAGSTALVQRGAVKKFRSMIPGVAEILVREVTYQPGGKTSRSMPHSMVCECTAGVLQVSQDAMTTTINTGEMWTCHKGMLETVENKGTIPAVMRVIELVPA